MLVNIMEDNKSRRQLSARRYREKHPDRTRQQKLIQTLKVKQLRQNNPDFDKICKIRAAGRKRLQRQRKATEASLTSHIGKNVIFDFIPNKTKSILARQYKVYFFLSYKY